MPWAVAARSSLSRAMRGTKAASESKSASGLARTRAISTLQAADRRWTSRTWSMAAR